MVARALESRFPSDEIDSRFCIRRMFDGEPGPLHLKMLHLSDAFSTVNRGHFT
jgi:hypothetical protein